MIANNFQSNEYADVKVLAGWVHGPASIHTTVPITQIEDVAGLSIHAITNKSARYFEALGATVTQSPPSALGGAISSGAAEAVVMPWEPMPSLGLFDQVNHHVMFAGDASLYSATHILAMNPASYAALTPALQAVIDHEAALQLSLLAAETMVKAWEQSQNLALEAGNQITVMDDTEVAKWVAASQAVWDDWSLDSVLRFEFDAYGLIDSALGAIGI